MQISYHDLRWQHPQKAALSVSLDHTRESSVGEKTNEQLMSQIYVCPSLTFKLPIKFKGYVKPCIHILFALTQI